MMNNQHRNMSASQAYQVYIPFQTNISSYSDKFHNNFFFSYLFFVFSVLMPTVDMYRLLQH